MLARLHLDLLIGKISLDTFRAALKILGVESEVAYNIAYENAMERIEEQNTERKSPPNRFCYVSLVQIQLAASELQHTLVIGQLVTGNATPLLSPQQREGAAGKGNCFGCGYLGRSLGREVI